MAACFLLPDAELPRVCVDTSPHFSQSICQMILGHCGQLMWPNASQEHTGPGLPLRESTPRGSYWASSRQSPPLGAHSCLEETLKGVGSYVQLRVVMFADGTACSAEIKRFFYSLWYSSALSRSKHCCIVNVHSWHRASEINISHPQIQQIITLALSLRDHRFWTPSSKLVPLLNICQSWSSNNTSVLPRNDPCEVKRMGQ